MNSGVDRFLYSLPLASSLVSQVPLVEDLAVAGENVTSDSYFYGQSPPIYPSRMLWNIVEPLYGLADVGIQPRALVMDPGRMHIPRRGLWWRG